jgi:hypothetical protein
MILLIIYTHMNLAQLPYAFLCVALNAAVQRRRIRNRLQTVLFG